MSRMIAVQLSAYLGIVKVASITLGRFNNGTDAHRFYEVMEAAGTDKTDALKRSLVRFFECELTFVIHKEEQ